MHGVVRGVIPNEVTVELTFDGFPMQRKTFPVRSGNGEIDAFTMILKPEEVQRNFSFRILANDATTPEFAVEVRPLPILVSRDGKPSPQVQLDYPRYTDLKTPHFLTPGTGNVEAVTGTIVTFRAAVDRPLKRAWIEYQPEVRETSLGAFLAPLASTHGIGAVTSLALSRTVYDRVEADLSHDGTQFTIRFRPTVHGMYSVHFEDEIGLESSRNYELRLRPDPAPVIRLDRPSASRDVLNVLPTAELPLQVVVEDLQFAIRSAYLEYRTQPNESPRLIPLYHHAKGPAATPLPVAGWACLATPVPRLRLQRLEFNRTLSMRSPAARRRVVSERRRHGYPAGVRRRLRRCHHKQGAGPQPPGRDPDRRPRENGSRAERGAEPGAAETGPPAARSSARRWRRWRRWKPGCARAAR